MGETMIEWTDKTWNPVSGCSKVSEGCRNCYAERVFPRAYSRDRVPVGFGSSRGRTFRDVKVHPDRLDAPLRWRKPARIFVNSMSDLFHEDVPLDFLAAVYHRMVVAKRHTFQVLTKRPERMYNFLTGPLATKEPLSNVWWGVSCEDQATADARIPLLLQTPAAVRFVSLEPLIGPITFRWDRWLPVSGWEQVEQEGVPLDWCIIGGESGPTARPCDVAWIRSIVRQCYKARVPVFVKQLGANIRDRNDGGFEAETEQVLNEDTGEWVVSNPSAWPTPRDVEHDPGDTNYQGAPVRVRLADRKGGDPSEWPHDLRIREFPHQHPGGTSWQRQHPRKGFSARSRRNRSTGGGWR